jgi:type I restriction enzyme S subunit
MEPVMSFPAYPEYKASGVQWLGQVPSTWASVPFGALFRRTKRTGFAEEELLSVYRDYGVIRKSDRDDNFNNASEDLSTYQLVEPGDLAMNKMKAWQGSLGISSHRGIVSPAYFVFAPRREFHPPFMHYLLRSPPYAAGYMTISKGIRINQWDVDPDHLSALPVLLPNFDEQKAIATFLDRETAKIDALVAEQERLIALLKEKRQAVISHAVTNGLNPDAPMKDSGIEWLGKIPADWDVVRIKNVVASIEQGWSPQCDATPVDGDDQWGVLKVGCVNGDRFNPRENKVLPPELEPVPELSLRAGDVLISRANTRELVGSAALVEKDFERLLLCDKLYRLRLKMVAAIPEFLTLFLRSTMARSQIEVAATGASSSMLNVGQAVILEMPLPLPPLIEQEEISARVRERRQQIEALLDGAHAAVTLLHERRAALISAAVTGKIDVRGAATISNVVPFKSASLSAGVPALRAVVGAYAIRELALMGRMAVMKAGFLAEAHVGLSDLNGRYERFAAGPYDRTLLEAMEHGALELCGIVTHDPRSAREAVTYDVPSTAIAAPGEALRALVGEDAAARLREMLSLLKGIGREGVEAVATIYAVWNDLLAAGHAADDEMICRGVLTDWHPEKAKKFKPSDLAHWLAWMRRLEFVPDGSAPRTDNQPKLF